MTICSDTIQNYNHAQQRNLHLKLQPFQCPPPPWSNEQNLGAWQSSPPYDRLQGYCNYSHLPMFPPILPHWVLGSTHLDSHRPWASFLPHWVPHLWASYPTSPRQLTSLIFSADWLSQGELAYLLPGLPIQKLRGAMPEAGTILAY